MRAALGIRSAAYLATPICLSYASGDDGAFDATDSLCYLRYTCYAPNGGVYVLLWNASIVGGLAMQIRAPLHRCLAPPMESDIAARMGNPDVLSDAALGILYTKKKRKCNKTMLQL